MSVATASPPYAAPPAPVRPAAAILPPAALAVLALHPLGCRWPLGEVADDDFRFCNARRHRGSYCRQHAASARATGRP